MQGAGCRVQGVGSTVASGRPAAARRADRVSGEERAAASDEAEEAEAASIAHDTLSTAARRLLSTTLVITTFATPTSAASAIAVRKESCSEAVNAAAVRGSPTSSVTKLSLVGSAVATTTGAEVVDVAGAGVVATVVASACFGVRDQGLHPPRTLQ